MSSVLLIFCLFTSFGLSDHVELWSTEHLLDLIQHDAYRKDVPAIRSAVVALYEKSCKNKLFNEYQFNDNGLPNGVTFLLTSFDVTSAANVWYEFDDNAMNLFDYYNISYKNKPKSEWCPTVLFQHQDWNKELSFYNPSVEDSFNSWVWKNLAVNTTFINNNDITVNLFIIYKDGHEDILNEQLLGTVNPNEEIIIQNLHSGDVVVGVDNNQNVLNRWLIDTVTYQIDIQISNDENILNYDKYNKKHQDKYTLQLQQDWSTRRRYLNNIRTPPLMPSFTDKGYGISQLPQDVCDYITNFAREQKARKRTEGFPKDGTQINAREIPTYMMHIPPQKKMWIGEQLKPFLEEWSGTKLVYSTIYGCREYVKGAVLKSHVDRIETHIISAIIHVSHEPELDVAPWPLELTQFDGKRVYVQDDVCSLTYYESSKLIHGRPLTYNGTSWINAFLHYRPDYWDSQGYKFTPQNEVITPQGRVHLVDFKYG